MNLHNFFSLTAVVFFLFTLTGCDQIYRLVQKEGAEEKDILGEVISFESNKKVQEVQKLLKLYGYNPGTTDGKFGVNTRNAIERFHKDNKLPAHRFVDRKTWERLNIFPKSGLVMNFAVNTKQAQTALQNAGFKPGKIDGRMGKKTLEVLKEFQKANGLKPDGKMGFKTLSKLEEYLEKRN